MVSIAAVLAAVAAATQYAGLAIEAGKVIADVAGTISKAADLLTKVRNGEQIGEAELKALQDENDSLAAEIDRLEPPQPGNVSG